MKRVVPLTPKKAKMGKEALIRKLSDFRRKIKFSKDTAIGGMVGVTPSVGHCAAVAILVRNELGGDFVSTKIGGQSHWFNRIGGVDIDLTGDQFGRRQIQLSEAGGLYPGTRIRKSRELHDETIRRATLLACRSGLY